MRIKSLVAAAVIVALGMGLVPPSARAEDNSTAVTTTRVDFQKAIAHAVEQSSGGRQGATVPLGRVSQPAMQSGYGGGGGHMMMVVSLVGMVAGIGMTYYMVKQMQKATGDATQAATSSQK